MIFVYRLLSLKKVSETNINGLASLALSTDFGLWRFRFLDVN